MSLEMVIDENRRAIEAEPIKAKAVFSVHGDLVGITEVDLHARGHVVKVGEPPSLGFTSIRLGITPTGPETAKRYRELADAVDAHCPVLDLFTNPTSLERRIALPALNSQRVT